MSTGFDTVAALELCEAAEPCADCGFEHTHGEGHGSDLPALIATLRAAVAEIDRLRAETAAELRIAALDAAERKATWDDAASDPIDDVCAIARQIAGQEEPPPSPEGRPPSPEEVKP